MPADEILVASVGPWLRVACFEDETLIRYAETTDDAPGRRDDIFLGLVRRRPTGLDAAFVDIGLAGDGLLMREDAPADGLPGEGAAVLVQVTRPAEAAKGAKLTMRPRLIGRHLVYAPHGRGAHLSRRLRGAAPRADVTARLARLPADGGGWVARHSAGLASAETCEAEAAALLAEWTRLGDAAGSGGAPRLLRHGRDAAEVVLDEALAPQTARLSIDDGETWDRLAARYADARDRLRLHHGPEPLFSTHDAEAQLEAALAPSIDLAGGGRLWVTETPALVAIDVDSGAAEAGSAAATAAAVNLEAVAAIGRAIRLRELGGRIVIDPVPMRQEADRRAVLAALRRALAEDDRRVTVGGFSRTGLIDLVRERTGPSLGQRLTRACPTCDGGGRVEAPAVTARRALAALLAETRRRPAWRPALRCAPAVAQRLRGAPLAAVERRLARPVTLIEAVDPAFDGFALDSGGEGAKTAS